MPVHDHVYDDQVVGGFMGDYVLHKLLLEQIQFTHNFRLSGHAVESLRLRDKTSVDYLRGTIRGALLELQTSILAEKLAHDVVPVYFSYPATWWDAFKLRFFPEWLLNKYPADYTGVTKKVDFKQYALYPSINKVFPEYPKEGIIIHSLTAIEGG